MVDNILLIIIILLIPFNFVVVEIWKKNLIKELYISGTISIVLFVINHTITIGLIVIYFVASRGFQYWIVLSFNLFMLLIYSLVATTCIFLQEDNLIKKNIFV